MADVTVLVFFAILLGFYIVMFVVLYVIAWIIEDMKKGWHGNRPIKWHADGTRKQWWEW